LFFFFVAAGFSLRSFTFFHFPQDKACAYKNKLIAELPDLLQLLIAVCWLLIKTFAILIFQFTIFVFQIENRKS